MLDDVDRRILALLQEDSRRSDRELARRAGSTGPTVAARIRRMEAAGIIQGYTVRLDDDAFAPVAGEASVPCHWCRQRTATPRWQTVGGREHPFCCPTCAKAFTDKHAQLSKGL